MLLRRVIEHVKKQQWTAVAIDFLIVVVGVFIGIQVSNWNAARVDQHREQEYIERLSKDFDSIIERSEGALDRWQGVVMASVRLRADIKEVQMNGAVSRAEDEVRSDFDTVFSGRIPAPKAATFVEMLSAGDVRLIQNPDVRNALFDYDSQAHYSLEAYRVLVSRTQDALNTLARYSEINTEEIPRDLYLDDRGNSIATVDIVGLSSDPEAVTAIKIIEMAADNHRGLTVAHLRFANQALEALNSVQ